MYTLFLNNTQVEIPSSLSQLQFEKVRDSFYWGFIYNKIGKADNTQLVFTEKLAIQIIKSEYEKNGIRGNVQVDIQYNSETIYQGNIDFTSIEFNANQCSCVLVDQVEIDDFFSNDSTQYSIPTDNEINIPSITTKGLVRYELTEALTYERPFALGLTAWHTIPFKTNKDQSVVEGSVYEPIQFGDIQNIYINTTDEVKTINVFGRLVFQARMGDTSIIQVRVNDNIVQTLATSAAYQSYEISIDTTVSIPPNQGVTIQVGNGNSPNFFGFIYSTDTYLLISELKNETLIPTPVIPSENLLREILRNVNPNLTLLYKAPVLNFTTGNNLRGLTTDIKTSFREVFDVLNKIYCLRLNIIDNVVLIEKRDTIKSKGGIILNNDSVNDYVFRPSIDVIHNTINVGYEKWRSKSVIGGDEYNTKLGYQTEYKNISNPLDLVVENIISSRYIIDEVRDLYDQTKTSEKGTNEYDETLFIVTTNGFNLETENILNDDALLNIEANPIQMINNWSPYILGKLERINAEGNRSYSYVLNGERFTINFIPDAEKIFSDTSFTLDVNIDLGIYSSISEVVSFLDEFGEKHTGIVKSISLTQSIGEGKAIIEAWKI